MSIKKAYDILSDPDKKTRYDVGLKLLKSDETTNHNFDIPFHFNIPYRCGMIHGNGMWSAGRFAFNEILSWNDIVENGKTLVSSWSKYENKVMEIWA